MPRIRRQSQSGKIEVFKKSNTRLFKIESFILLIAMSAGLIIKTDIHPAFCIVISITAAGILFIFFRSRIGFYVISIVFSAMWGVIVGNIVQSYSDLVWSIVSGVFVFIMALFSHMRAKRYYDNVREN